MISGIDRVLLGISAAIRNAANNNQHISAVHLNSVTRDWVWLNTSDILQSPLVNIVSATKETICGLAVVIDETLQAGIIEIRSGEQTISTIKVEAVTG